MPILNSSNIESSSFNKYSRREDIFIEKGTVHNKKSRRDEIL
jgi:hypothetical protein